MDKGCGLLKISPPPQPSSVLRDYIKNHLDVSQADLARALGISKVRVSQLMNGRARITPATALRLARVVGRTPEEWLQLQLEFDLFKERQRLDACLSRLPRLAQEAS